MKLVDIKERGLEEELANSNCFLHFDNNISTHSCVKDIYYHYDKENFYKYI